MPSLIKIEVTPDIAAKIRFLAESGVFAIKTGNATINFHKGDIKSIKTDFFYYPQLDAKETVDFIKSTPIL